MLPTSNTINNSNQALTLQLEVAEKLQHSRYYESGHKVVDYLSGYISTGLFATGSIMAYNSIPEASLNNLINAIPLVRNLNPFYYVPSNPFSDFFTSSDPSLTLRQLALILVGARITTGICSLILKEKAKNLKIDAQTLLDIIDNKPIVIVSKSWSLF